MSRRIPVAGPSITDREIAAVAEAVRHGWYENASDFQKRFETAFASYVGVRHALSLPSATSGLHLALAASDIGPGDEVIVPESTWIATAAPISYVGATPVFVDVDPASWCLAASAFESAIGPKTKAVIPVDLYGGVPDYDEIMAIARSRDIVVIEDAAEAVGSKYHDRRAGALGQIGVFSFHGSKTLTTGEGGMLVTDDDAVARRCAILRDHGRLPGDTLFRNVEIGYKYRMSALQAALGLAQLERVGELVEKKRTIFGWYRRELAGIPGITLNHEAPGTYNAYWMVTAVIDPGFGLGKEEIIDGLKQANVDCRPFFYPLSSLDAYRGMPFSKEARERNPTAYRLSATGVNLPSALELTEADVATACVALRTTLGIA